MVVVSAVIKKWGSYEGWVEGIKSFVLAMLSMSWWLDTFEMSEKQDEYFIQVGL